MDPRREIGLRIEDIETPALLVDADALERNIRVMQEFLAPLPCRCRPHAKTHKCPVIARKQVAAGALGVTCAKISEAEVMADGGIESILIANEVAGRGKARRLAELARRVELLAAVDNEAPAREMAEAAREAGATVHVLIELDVGNGRCGVGEERALELARLVDTLPGLRLRGVMGYEGFCCYVEDAEKKAAMVREAMGRLIELRRRFLAAGLPADICSGSSTSTCRISAMMPGMTEVQPGSYVFMDGRYQTVAPEFEIALTVLASVISRNAERVMLDVGRKGIADDMGMPAVAGHPELEADKTSEEHTRALVKGKCDLRVGDQVRLIPRHCCCTANLHNWYHVVRDGRVEDVWPIAARGAFR